MLDWDNLRILLAVDTAGSVSSAAKVLGIDKATIVRHLSTLEQVIGVRLVDRRARGWRATEAGRRLIQAAHTIETNLTDTLADLAGRGGIVRPSVRLTAPLWFCSEVLMPRFDALIAAAPWLDLDITAGSRMLNLAQREAEIALRNTRPRTGDFVVRKVGELGSALYATSRYLTDRPSVTCRLDLTDHRFAAYTSAISYVPGFRWLEEMADQVVIGVRADDAHALCAAVKSGTCVAVLPCFLGDREPSLQRILGERHLETIWLVAPSDLARSRPARAVARFVAQAFSKSAIELRGRE